MSQRRSGSSQPLLCGRAGSEIDAPQHTQESEEDDMDGQNRQAEAEKKIRLKVDWRLCTIAGILCSLDLLDSGIISSASVTTMREDLDLQGNRYVGLPASYSGIYPGLTYLLSTWYTRNEQQLRFALLQSGEVIVLATGGIVNFGLNHLHTHDNLRGWQWMFLVQGLFAMALGILTYWWMIDFPENAHKSFYFISKGESEIAVARIQRDRGDVNPEPFTWVEVFRHFADPKIYGFCAMFFLLNLVSTSLSYFLPIILQNGMGFSSNQAILLSAPPYYYAVIPLILSSWVGDRYELRGPVITFNAACTIAGFAMLGFSDQVTVRYAGTYLATGAYISNWAALNAYQANNIVGQWKRAVTAAAVSACNGLGGVAGSFIVRQNEAPHYMTAIWVSIGSHILMIGFVLVFTTYFYHTNKRQKRGKKVIERTDGFRYIY
ncbi:MAG: hypothetical protein M1827_006954 [Pycnora praestabilis]|nr:MAG: hypothetical protein M1827_006954 [Pycnora praestabilis]